MRVDTAGAVKSAIDPWNWNPILFLWLIPILLLLAGHKFGKSKAAARFAASKYFLFTIGCIFGIWAVFEHYYMSLCPVSHERLVATRNLFDKNLDIMDSLKQEYWVDDGTLLVILRQNPLNPWDQDADTYVEFKSHQWLSEFLEVLQERNGDSAVVSYKPSRQLIQIMGTDGCHMDIWVWKRDEQADVLTNHDWTFSADVQSIPVDVIYPIQSVPWQGRHVSIPAQPELRASMQFGPNFMTPYYNRFMCLENIGTFRISNSRLLFYLTLAFGCGYLCMTKGREQLLQKLRAVQSTKPGPPSSV